MSYTAFLLIKLWWQNCGSVTIFPAVTKMPLLNQLIHYSSYSWETHSFSASQRIPHLSQNLRFVIMFTTVQQWSLNQANRIPVTLPHPISVKSILISLSNLQLDLPSDIFPPSKVLCAFLVIHIWASNLSKIEVSMLS